MESFTSNAAPLAQQLQRYATRVGDPRPALERLRRMLGQGEQQVWGSQGAALGVHWAEAVEADRKEDPALLVATGALRASLTGEGAGDTTEVQLRFGTDVPYGVFHQHGTSRMPARPFLGITPDMEHTATDLFAQLLAEAEA